ncbi:MAG TPA: AAA family ATPase, partial [Candidatus Hydrogenedentes bacterium]|nr:AAA family ATPase [Candidatus Hydrogenedentota bacterium]
MDGGAPHSPALLRKINRIRGHRVFRDFTWTEELEPFGRYNLIYGWNGSGKTTLAGLFLHLERASALTEGEAEFTMGGRRVSGTEFPHAAGLPRVRVFTRGMTASTVLEGGTDLHPVYYLGKENVEAQQELEKRSTELAADKARSLAADAAKQKAGKELDQFCTDQARHIKDFLARPGSPYITYNKTKFSLKCNALAADGVEHRPLSPERRTELRRLADGSVKEGIPEVVFAAPLPGALAREVRELLARTVVSQVITRLSQHPEEAEWVREGLALHGPNASPQPCKFCGNMISQERLGKLEGHFNDQYTRFLREIDTARERVAEALRLVRECQLPDPARFYDNLAGEYKEARDAFVRSLEGAGGYLEKLSAALSAKRDKPFESLDLERFAPNEQ